MIRDRAATLKQLASPFGDQLQAAAAARAPCPDSGARRLRRPSFEALAPTSTLSFLTTRDFDTDDQMLQKAEKV